MSKVLVLTDGFQQMRESDGTWKDMGPVPYEVLKGLEGPVHPNTGPMRLRFESVHAAVLAQKRTCWLASRNDHAVLYVETMPSGREHPEHGFVTFFTGQVRVMYHRAEEMELDEFKHWEAENPNTSWPKLGVRWAGDDHMEFARVVRPSDLGNRYYSILDMLGIPLDVQPTPSKK